MDIREIIKNQDFDLFAKKCKEFLDKKMDNGEDIYNFLINEKQLHLFKILVENTSYEEMLSVIKINPLLSIYEKNENDFLLPLIKMKGFDINFNKFKGADTLINYAIYLKNKEVVDYLLLNNVNYLIENNKGFNAINESIINNDKELFDYFYDKVNFPDYYKESMIENSITNNVDKDIFNKLIGYSNLNHDYIFSVAKTYKRLDVINKILEYGDFVPGKEQIMDIIELMCEFYDDEESQKYSADIFDQLKEIKIPFNSFVNKKEQNAWMLAVQNNNTVIFDKLLNETNDVLNKIDEEGHTPLFYAIKKNNLEYVKKLLKRKINSVSRDKENNTPLIYATKFNYTEIVKELLKNPSIINESNIHKETALSLAIHNKNIELTEELLWHGADILRNNTKIVNDINIFGLSENNNFGLMFSSVEEKEINNFSDLIKMGLNVNKKNQNGDMYIHHFIKNGMYSNFKAILKCSVDINVVDANGDSPIMIASQKSNDNYFMNIIKNYDVDLNIKNKNNKNLIDICIKNNKINFINEIIKNENVLDTEKEKILDYLINSNVDISILENYRNILNENTCKNNDKIMNTINSANINNFIILLDFYKNNYFYLMKEIDLIENKEIKEQFKCAVKIHQPKTLKNKSS